MKAKGTSSLYTCGVRSKTPTNCKENWRSLRPWREIQGSHGAKQQHKNYNCNCKLQKFATISPPLTSIFIQQLHLLSYNSVPPIQILHSFIIFLTGFIWKPSRALPTRRTLYSGCCCLHSSSFMLNQLLELKYFNMYRRANMYLKTPPHFLGFIGDP